MPGIGEPRHSRRLGIDPASVALSRRLLLLGARNGDLPESVGAIEAMTDLEVIQRAEPLVFPQPLRERLRERLRHARDAEDRADMATTALEAKRAHIPVIEIAHELGYKTKRPVYQLIRRGR